MRRIKHIMIVIAAIALALFVVRYPTSWLGTAVLIQCVGVLVIFPMSALSMTLREWLTEGFDRPQPYSDPDPPPQHELRKGQKVILPDGTPCRITDLGPSSLRATLQPIPPRADWDGDVRVTEAFLIQPEGEIILAKTWHWGPGPCHGSEPTGWTIADLGVKNVEDWRAWMGRQSPLMYY